MKLFIILLLVWSSWMFADTIDDQVDALQVQMQKALDIRNLNDANIQKKMQEISESLSSTDLNSLNNSVNNPPSGMSQEEFQRMNRLVQQELNKHGVSKEDLEQLKRQISDLISSQ